MRHRPIIKCNDDMIEKQFLWLYKRDHDIILWSCLDQEKPIGGNTQCLELE